MCDRVDAQGTISNPDVFFWLCSPSNLTEGIVDPLLGKEEAKGKNNSEKPDSNRRPVGKQFIQLQPNALPTAPFSDSQ